VERAAAKARAQFNEDLHLAHGKYMNQNRHIVAVQMTGGAGDGWVAGDSWLAGDGYVTEAGDGWQSRRRLRKPAMAEEASDGWARQQ
jgi:hypothetical protein